MMDKVTALHARSASLQRDLGATLSDVATEALLAGADAGNSERGALLTAATMDLTDWKRMVEERHLDASHHRARAPGSATGGGDPRRTWRGNPTATGSPICFGFAATRTNIRRRATRWNPSSRRSPRRNDATNAGTMGKPTPLTGRDRTRCSRRCRAGRRAQTTRAERAKGAFRRVRRASLPGVTVQRWPSVHAAIGPSARGARKGGEEMRKRGGRRGGRTRRRCGSRGGGGDGDEDVQSMTGERFVSAWL